MLRTVGGTFERVNGSLTCDFLFSVIMFKLFAVQGILNVSSYG